MTRSASGMGRLRWPLLGALFGVLLGCSSGSTAHSVQTSEAVQTVRAYFMALADGRFAAANALRCPALQVETHAAPQALHDELALLPPDVRSFELTSASGSPSAAAQGSPTVTVTVTLKGSARPFAMRVVGSGASARVCDELVLGADALIAKARLVPNEVRTAWPREAITSVPPPAGFVAVPGSPWTSSLTTLTGFLGRTTAEWKHSDGTRLRVAAYDFDNSANAKAAQQVANTQYASLVTAVIAIDGPSAVGFRVLSGAPVVPQPPDVAPYADIATVRFGSRLYALEVAPLPAGADSHLVQAVALTIFTFARFA